MRFEEFDQLIIGYLAGLWKAVHAAADLNTYIIVVNERREVVLGNDGRWEHVQGNMHVFVVFHGGPKVEVLEIARHEFGVRGRANTVEE
jgi:hypothetical protein